MSHRSSDMAGMRRTAENYERYFVPRIGAPMAADLIAVACLRPGERVLDAACGTGVVTKLAAERVAPGGAVAALDPNSAMLAVARATTRPGASIDWHQARAEDLPFADESFDAVLCAMGLQFFSNKDAALREFYRVLGSRGRLLANVPGPTPHPFEIMADGLARHIGPESASFVHMVFSLHDPNDLRNLATQAGFANVDVRSTDTLLELPPPAEFLWQYVWSTPLAATMAQVDQERRAALENEFSERCHALAPTGMLLGSVRMTTLLAVK
jgi:ubiquinone/menaquinone biosynthesis C-methylase UbiE